MAVKSILLRIKRKFKKRMYWLAYVIIGILLGTISVLIEHIPVSVATWSGIVLAGNHIGYLLVAFIIVCRHYKKWLKAFASSSLALVTASFIYYTFIILINIDDPSVAVTSADIKASAMDFAMWSCISLVCCLLISAAMWLIGNAKHRFVRMTAISVSYVGMLGVIFYCNVVPVVNFMKSDFMINSGYMTKFVGNNCFISDIYQIVLALTAVTLFFVFVYRKVLTENV